MFPLNFFQQETKVTGVGINYFKTSKYSDIVLDKNLSKPTNIYFNNSDLHLNRPKIWFFFTGMALGLIPESTRYDRDSYIEVYKENIIKPYLRYYEKETTMKNYLAGFDYGSVMFPEKLFGSKNYLRTYKAKYYPFYDAYSGMEWSFTVNDSRRLNRMYCKNQYPSLKGCNNRGFPYTHNGCQICLCNTHFLEPKCDVNHDHTHISCGTKSFYKSYRKNSYITRKNVNGSCYYRIKSLNGKKVAITVNSLVSSSRRFNLCLYFGLNIYYRSDWSVSPLVICPNTSKVVIPALNNEVYMVYYKSSFDPPVNFTITYRSA
uniref:Metalloendopeptidase n=1 Tax=Strongyloides venezuelensis TaxID=75913 RepID=A0A0K0F313_STRVS